MRQLFNLSLAVALMLTDFHVDGALIGIKWNTDTV